MKDEKLIHEDLTPREKANPAAWAVFWVLFTAMIAAGYAIGWPA